MEKTNIKNLKIGNILSEISHYKVLSNIDIDKLDAESTKKISYKLYFS